MCGSRRSAQGVHGGIGAPGLDRSPRIAYVLRPPSRPSPRRLSDYPAGRSLATSRYFAGAVANGGRESAVAKDYPAVENTSWTDEMRMAVAAFWLVGFGCGATKQCADMQVLAVDEARMCLGPPMKAAGLQVCLNPADIQGKGIDPVCLIDESGGMFLGWVGSTEWFEGSGWTHGAVWTLPSTLTPESTARCARAPSPSFVQTCQ
jgi:hypothetical protein